MTNCTNRHKLSTRVNEAKLFFQIFTVNFRANQALRKAELMLRNTERELAQIKRKKTTSTRVGNKPVRGGGQSGRGGRGGQTGRGLRGGRGGGRGGASGRKTSDVKVSQDDLDKQLDSYMLKTKGGLDAQMDDYMSKTKVRNHRFFKLWYGFFG